MGAFGGNGRSPDNMQAPPMVGGQNAPGQSAANNASWMKQYQAGGAPIRGTNIQGTQISPYQQGLTPQQIQQGQQRMQQGMGMAQQSYDKMGQMGGMFMNNAQNAGNAAYNPAIGAYQQALNQNSQNIGSQLASQRGSAANPGLAARNVGQAGATAAQNAAGQMSSQVAQFKEANQGAAANAYQGQGQMAGVYGNMASAYAQAGLANQGQVLNAIAAQNAANVAMQSNLNSSNVAMQSNINNAGVAMQSNINDVMAQQQMGANQAGASMYNAGLGYDANLYGSYMGFQGNKYAGSGTGGLFGGGGFLGLGLAKGGEVPDAKTAKRQAFVKALQGVPKYAKGGRIPEARRKKMAEGGDPGDMGGLGSMGGGAGEGASEGSSPFHLMDQSQMNLMSGEQGGFPTDPGGSGNQPMSAMGKILQGMGGVQMSGGGGGGRGGGGGGGGDGASQIATMALMALLAKGGRVQQPRRMAQGSIVPDTSNPGVVQAQGTSMPNFALAGSPQPQIAMPSTGLPMGNAQTKGGGPMPSPGMSGSAGFGQPQPGQKPPGMMARGGGVQYGRRTRY